MQEFIEIKLINWCWNEWEDRLKWKIECNHIIKSDNYKTTIWKNRGIQQKYGIHWQKITRRFIDENFDE